jgi:hypothetical protein
MVVVFVHSARAWRSNQKGKGKSKSSDCSSSCRKPKLLP